MTITLDLAQAVKPEKKSTSINSGSRRWCLAEAIGGLCQRPNSSCSWLGLQWAVIDHTYMYVGLQCRFTTHNGLLTVNLINTQTH